MRDYFMISECDGALYDTRAANWANRPLRPNYSRHHSTIASAADFKACLRAGGFAWPGGYPLYFATSDGATISFESARENAREIIAAIMAEDLHSGWRVVACAINWDDPELYCEHSGDRIEAAYGDDS